MSNPSATDSARVTNDSNLRSQRILSFNKQRGRMAGIFLAGIWEDKKYSCQSCFTETVSLRLLLFHSWLRRQAALGEVLQSYLSVFPEWARLFSRARRRNSPGVTPSTLLKSVLRYSLCRNPHRLAMTISDHSVSARSFFTRSSWN